jgi:2-hydroxyglutaryl-CoA dehydratase, D-component
VLGRTVPRELVVAAGMLPIRLSPRRLPGRGHGAAGVPPGLAGELGSGPARVASALLGGELDWVDAVVIGRDTEAYTRLFYVLRELRRIGVAPAGPPVAFFDLLSLPTRTSAIYNRLRARELAGTIAKWAGRAVGHDDLASAVADARATAVQLRSIAERRAAPRPVVSGSEALVAAGAAEILPGAELRDYLAAAPSSVESGRTSPARVFLTGSGQEDLLAYEALEEAGFAVVGEDHEWGDDGSQPPELTADPMDGIVDRYHFRGGGAARAGLRERTQRTVRLAEAADADALLQIIDGDDEAAGWELPTLRALLGDQLPVVSVRIAESQRDAGITRAVGELRRAVAGD